MVYPSGSLTSANARAFVNRYPMLNSKWRCLQLRRDSSSQEFQKRVALPH